MNATIVHISDLHFHTYPQNFREWKSKRIIGTGNLFLHRARQFPIKRAKQLVEQIQNMKWDHLVISGDLTQLSLERGFSLARETLEPLLKDPERVTIIPGNHDRYVKHSAANDYYKQYFGEFFGDEEIHVCKLNSDWVIVGWDSAHPNDWLTAAGTVRRSTIRATEKLLLSFPEKTRFVIVNHYPLTFPEGWKFDQFHELYNLIPVRNWILRHPNIRLYLHGHIHRNWTHHLPRVSTPELLLVNSASSTSTPYTGQKSSFHQIDLQEDNVRVTPIMLE
ncbi:MAG TPA: metallophosphoesterase [Candidatus Lambdaproteobacteria bacterium]|nr:metallophosphoesterase [Deltaproteobacteria bacterium]HHZ78191.1 metallophosphoesterase [Candidatus Lambdaproteobacteria bacterium]HIA57784.1 metallophosphoesterase [Candidatus Lambdaproteobacteria bacterium]HIB44731.1 metallophosphoesterase [Candidatus Lambdaproteobacteria bacterium]HIB94262.1 metallophosphoesterase [Candidatus Lambdaproteobacteria bacterium]